MWSNALGADAEGNATHSNEASPPSPPQAEEEASPKQCRICLSSDERELGGLVAPCNCSGSIRYVHVQCLRTWRRQGSWKAAVECPVCRAPYHDDLSRRTHVLQLFIRCPVASAACGGALLLRLLVPWLHRHGAGAAWMYAAAPLRRRLDLWRTWEVRSGAAGFAARWLLSGMLSLMLPALADHFLAVVSGNRPAVARASELVLLIQLCGRLRFLGRAAWVRSYEGTRIGLQAKRRCFWAIDEALKQALARREQWELRDLHQKYAAAGFGVPGRRLRDLAGIDMRLLRMLLGARVRTEVAMLLSDGERWVWWWPHVLLWYWAEQEVPATMLARATAVGALLATSAGPVLASVGVSDTQAQAVLFSVLTLLCSAFRGAQAVRLLALQLSVV